MPATNRTTQQDRDRKMIAGIQQHLAKQSSIVIRGVTYTPEQLVASIQADLNVADAATQARSKLADAAAAARASRTKLRSLITGFRAYVNNMFTDAAIVTDFGFTPPKAGTQTVATMAEAAAKRAATRKARNTLGSVQKKKIKGTVPATAPAAPVTVAPAPAPAAPAAAGGPGGGTTPHGA